MAGERHDAWPIRLRRSTPRLLVLPLLLVVLGATVAAGGWTTLGGVPAAASVAGGGLVTLAGLALGAALLTVRARVEEAEVRVSWLGGRRRYRLSRGPVTRVALRGPQASALRARVGLLGWAIGRATLRGSEPIEIVRLAATPTVILVPTERGRLALAPESEEELLRALESAARSRQRTAEQAARAVAAADAALDATLAESATLTGIERSVLEERLAAEAEAAARAEAERRAAERAEAERLAAERAEAERAAAAELAALRWHGRLRRRIGGWVDRHRPPRPGVRVAAILLPLLGAAAIWGGLALLDRVPDPGTDEFRHITLALVLGGPATVVAAVLARIWWPRLLGVVVVSGMSALLIATRALLGPA